MSHASSCFAKGVDPLLLLCLVPSGMLGLPLFLQRTSVNINLFMGTNLQNVIHILYGLISVECAYCCIEIANDVIALIWNCK